MNDLFAGFDPHQTAALVSGWIGHAVLFGTLLAGATWFVSRFVSRRARPALHAALWIIVLVKFIVPFGPSWSLSLASTTHAATAWFGETFTSDANAATPTTPDETVQVLFLTPLDGGAPMTASPPREVAATWPITTVLALLYVIGVMLTAGVRIVAYVRFARRCHRLASAEPETLAWVRAACARYGFRRGLSVLVTNDVRAPFVFGVIRPTLVLSRLQLGDANELEAVVLHEIAHLRRGDMFLRYLQWFVGTLLFFWPVVAWVNRRIDLAREHCCDEWALSHGRISAGEYARCLLRAVQPVRSRFAIYAPAAMAKNLDTVERRIEMILESPSRRRAALGIPAAALLLAWGGFVLTGVAAVDDDGNTVTAPAGGDGNVKMVIVTKTVDADGNVVVDKRIVEGDEVGELVLESEDGPFSVLLKRVLAAHGHGDIDVDVDVEAFGDHHAVFVRKMADHHAAFGKWMGHAGGDAPHAMMITGAFGGADLEQFAEDYPNADVDSDGAVSQVERQAYLVALAMTDPDGVLEQFPHADGNDDGTLEPSEAARLVGHTISWQSSNGSNFMATRIHTAFAHGLHKAHVAEWHAAHGEEDAENGAPHGQVVIEAIIEVDGDAEMAFGDAEGRMKILLELAEDGTAPHFEFKCANGALKHLPHGIDLEKLHSAANWLLDNVDADPSSATVESYLDVVEDASPTDFFFQNHPDADTDDDGEVSKAELAEFLSNLKDQALNEVHEGGMLRFIGDGDHAGAHYKVIRRTYGAVAPHGTLKCIMLKKDEDGNVVKIEVDPDEIE